VREVASQSRDLLADAAFCRGHQLAMTPVPQVVAMHDPAGHAVAAGLDGVFIDEFRLDRRQVPVPIDDPLWALVERGIHVTPARSEE
jgi:hypothetical protein